jgi:hypothetical protein
MQSRFMTGRKMNLPGGRPTCSKTPSQVCPGMRFNVECGDGMAPELIVSAEAEQNVARPIPDLERAIPASISSPRLAHRRQAVEFAKQIIKVAAHAES